MAPGQKVCTVAMTPSQRSQAAYTLAIERCTAALHVLRRWLITQRGP